MASGGYDRLDPDKIVVTTRKLRARIEARFPGSGLGGVSEVLVRIASGSAARAEEIARPIIPLRIGLAALLVTLPIVIVWSFRALEVSSTAVELADLIQALEAGTNEILLLGGAAFFLGSVERRIRRAQALRALHELRSIAHIIDMHQLTKDSEFSGLAPTPESPNRTLSRGEVERYLDYCSEMLSVVGKIAALYAQVLDDEVVLGAVNEVESLATGLSQKIWQKITIIRGDAALA